MNNSDETTPNTDNIPIQEEGLKINEYKLAANSTPLDLDTGHQIDQEALKGLSGSSLSADWPIITPDDVVIARFDNFDPEEELAVDRFSFSLIKDQKRLDYVAVDHSSDPGHPQLNKVDRMFHDAKPTIVLYEGPPVSYDGEAAQYQPKTRDEAMLHGGEMGYARFLVHQHNGLLNEGEDPIQLESADQPKEDWINDFNKKGYTNEQVAVFDLLRQVYFHAHSANEQGLDIHQAESEFRQRIEDTITNIEIPFEHRLVPRSDGQVWNWDLLNEEVRKVTGKEISFDLDYTEIAFTKEMFQQEAVFRDQFIVRKIADTFAKNDRVMVVFGTGHALRQESALKQFFE